MQRAMHVEGSDYRGMPWWIVGASTGLRLLTDYLASSGGTVCYHDDLPLEEGGWKLVHRQADPLITPQPLQRSIREPSNSRRAAATQGDLDVESAQYGDCDDLGMLVNFGDAQERYLAECEERLGSCGFAVHEVIGLPFWV
jgi:hypothetical protein